MTISIEAIATLLLQEVTARVVFQADDAGNLLPVWPTPAEVIAAVVDKLAPAGGRGDGE